MDSFQAKIRLLGIELTEKQLGQFDAYRKELVKWNERTNLTAITEPEEIEVKHFIDSLTVLRALPLQAKSFIDIGSGAGFPGLCIKIARPDLDVTLVEATAKKVEFLSHVISTLSLSGIRAVHGRAEELGRDSLYREQFDAAAARAVTELSALAELALPFVKTGGFFIAQKSAARIQSEIESAVNAIQELGGQAPELIPVTFPGLPERQLVLIKKTASTPAKYPRRSGIPSKRPIT